MGTVAQLLKEKGARVHCVSPTWTVFDATQLMNSHKIGALVVVDGEMSCERVVGMFTERDVLTRVVGEQRDPRATLVEDVMSQDVAFCTPETTVEEVSAMMRQRRIRHLPVCEGDGGELKGLLSIGDINAWHADGQATEIHYLNEYIHGRV